MIFSPSIALLLLAVCAFAAAYAGIAMSAFPGLSRKVLPFSGVMLLLVSVFWVLPELAEDFGWAGGSGLMILGFLLLALIDRYVYPVCPSCSPAHDHDHCATRLHGFAAPLMIATGIHSFFDGWALSAAQIASRQGIWAGVILHKLPESLAFGILLRAAMRSRSNAVLGAAGAQVAMIAGAALEIALAPFIGPWWLHVLLAIAGGTFLYLGFHAVHGEWKRRRAFSHSFSNH
ncbi:MAG TPA: ZIP family metal transporter [Bryobacteraceae bacterium]|nr:ZIP family metal transporter [Bryobacteraceae bacterium]